MTGTAATEADEFRKIYELEVIVVPTHRPISRKDNIDFVYKTVRGKYSALVDEIKQRTVKASRSWLVLLLLNKNEIISRF